MGTSVCELSLICVIFSAVTSVRSESIMCVSCNSREDRSAGDCEINPPEPTRCQEVSGVKKYCVIAKEYTKEDKLVGFARSCSTDNHGDSCKDMSAIPNAPAKICYTTCNTDGCNSAKSLHTLQTASVLSLSLAISLSMGLLCMSWASACVFHHLLAIVSSLTQNSL